MSLLDLGALYLVVGLGCAVILYRRSAGPRARRVGSAALGLVLWPIWAPVALIEDAPPKSRSTDRAARVTAELEEAVRAARGSPFEVLFSADAAARIREEMETALTRIAELDEVLARPGFERDAAERRVSELAGRGSKRAIETAVLHRNNVTHIEALRDRNERAIEELAELVGALRSQLVLARYAGSSAEGVGGIVTELWARVESLGEVMEATAQMEGTPQP